MARTLYPGGKKKVFTLSYDDGVLQDVRLVGLLDKYGVKGTFNLNSGLMAREFEWTHESGMAVKRLSVAAARELYGGHEVASHTLTHPYLEKMGARGVTWEMREDRDNLRRIFGREIPGFAVPFDYYSPLIADCARACGFEYARISEMSLSYAPPTDPYHWRAGVFHLSPELEDFVDGFLETGEELALCQIVGHSYDLDAADMWDELESILRRVSSAPDVVFMTNIEIVRYLRSVGYFPTDSN